jgi:hypothetical protein
MSIEVQVLCGILSVGIAFASYNLGRLDGAAAQRLQDYRRWRERKIRWREFEDL